MILFGIKNCDTVRKALKWLAAQQIDVEFHDFREHGLAQEQLTAWVKQHGWEVVFNKRSTSFRALSDSDKTNLNEDKAIALMLAQPTLIKRPVLVDNDRILIGFKETTYKEWFNL